MSKAVLISIKPEWCELIANGNKTIEVRKTRPKLETPFKCYIYCTLPKSSGDIFLIGCEKPLQGNGKVIGEFMCYDISAYESEFYPHDEQPIYEAITEWNEENEVWEAVASNNDTYITNFLKNTCMCLEDFRAYLGAGEIPFYGWHISDLVIYDKPKELSEFEKPCPYDEDCWKCKFYDGGSREEPPSCNWEDFELTKPPQSWCYVEARKK